MHARWFFSLRFIVRCRLSYGQSGLMKRIHIFVEGKVQGVFFRHHTMQTASAYNIKGWVKNLRDGRVEMVCEGSEEDIERMIEWCRQGPPGSHVRKIDTAREEYGGEFESFEIVY